MYGCTHPTPERFAAACKSAANVITELPRGVIGSVYGTHLRREDAGRGTGYTLFTRCGLNTKKGTRYILKDSIGLNPRTQKRSATTDPIQSKPTIILTTQVNHITGTRNV